MTKSADVTLAYIDRRPASAARVLAAQPAVDAAKFISSIPTRYAVRVLARFNVRHAATVLRLADTAAAASVMRDMEFSAAAAILRQISPDQRESILAGLSRRQRHSFELTLSFPPDTVGAHMSTTIDVLSTDDTAGDALRLKKDHQEVRSTLTFVVNDDRQLVGAVDLLTLIKRPGKTRLSELADATYAAVSPQMPLSQAASLDAWRRFNELPVISRRGDLLGVIFRQFEHQIDEGTADPDPETLTSAAFSALGYCTLGLLELLNTVSADQPGTGGPHVG